MADQIISASGVYQISNLKNGKRYIGSSISIRRRMNEHISALRKGTHPNRLLQRSWGRYGESAFGFSILEFCEPKCCLDREQWYLDNHKPELNICPVARNTLGRKLSAETKDKIRQLATGRKMPPRSKEYRASLSERFKGAKKSPAHMQALQDGRRARIYTDDQKEKISNSLKAAYESGLRPREKTEDHKIKIGKFYAKLTDDDVREIRRLRKGGITGVALARMFGSNTGTISEICSGKRYRWVAD